MAEPKIGRKSYCTVHTTAITAIPKAKCLMVSEKRTRSKKFCFLVY